MAGDINRAGTLGPSVPGGGAVQDGKVREGNTGSHSVSGPVSAESQLNQLAPNSTSEKPVGERNAEEVTPETPVSKGKSEETKTDKTEKEETENLDGLSEEQLQEKQDKKLEEVAEATHRYESFSLLGRVTAALKNPRNAPKDLKLSVTLPGEQPVTLFPWSDEVEGLPNIERLMDVAKSVLEEYEAANFKDYDSDKDFRLLGDLQNSIRDIANRLGDNKYREGAEGGFKNNWEQRFNAVRHKPVCIEAYEGGNNNSSRVDVEKLLELSKVKDKGN